MCKEILTFNCNLERSRGCVNRFHVLVLNVQTESFGLFTKLHHHFRTADSFRIAWKILDIACQHQLPTGHVTSEHEGFEHGSSSVQSSSVSCRTRTDNDDIVNIRHLTHSSTNTPMDLNIIPLFSRLLLQILLLQNELMPEFIVYKPSLVTWMSLRTG